MSDGLEAGHGERELVLAGGQAEDPVEAVLVRDGRLCADDVLAGHGHGHAGQDGAGGVLDGAGDAASRALCEERRAES